MKGVVPELQRYADIARRIWRTTRDTGFAGTDPYDGLNSRLLAPVLGRSRLLRLAVIQGVKRSPIDLRPLLGIPPGVNPKGVALFLQGAADWPDLVADRTDLNWLGDTLLSVASKPDGTPLLGDRKHQPGLISTWDAGVHAVGWGYDFPWQSKAFLQPAYFPTVVATSFVLDALLMARTAIYTRAASAAARFVADHLFRYEHVDGLCFSYSPGDQSRVYNASLFGARILAQAAEVVPGHSGPWRELAARAVDFVVSRQRDNGSWEYGEADHWHWIDNLHTGFNLETIERLAAYLGTDRWDTALEKGLDFYRRVLFESDGIPRYYSDSRYPLDPHSFAQGALTFLRLRRFQADAVEFTDRILQQGIVEMWDERRGGFIFQKHRYHTQHAIHLRWSQAWMFRALCARLAMETD